MYHMGKGKKTVWAFYIVRNFISSVYKIDGKTEKQTLFRDSCKNVTEVSEPYCLSVCWHWAQPEAGYHCCFHSCSSHPVDKLEWKDVPGTAHTPMSLLPPASLKYRSKMTNN